MQNGKGGEGRIPLSQTAGLCPPAPEGEVRVTPRIRGCLSSGRVELLRMISGVALDCRLLSDVNRVTVDFN